MKKCPYCAEDIQDAAIVCKHCGRDLPSFVHTDTEAVPPKKKPRNASRALIAYGIVGLIVVFASVRSLFGPQAQSLVAHATFNGLTITIENQNADPWFNTELKLNDDYTYSAGKVEAGGTVTMNALQFAKSDGARFNPIATKPRTLIVVANTPNYDSPPAVAMLEWK